MEYIFQIDRYSCGPTAIYNALVWANREKKQNRYSLRRIFHQCHCSPNLGTINRDLQRTLEMICQDTSNHLKIIPSPNHKSYYEGYQVTLEWVRVHLLQGRAILLNFHWRRQKETGEHYVLLADIQTTTRQRHKILVVNPDEIIDDGVVSKWYHSSQIEEELLIQHQFLPGESKYKESEDPNLSQSLDS